MHPCFFLSCPRLSPVGSGGSGSSEGWPQSSLNVPLHVILQEKALLCYFLSRSPVILAYYAPFNLLKKSHPFFPTIQPHYLNISSSKCPLNPDHGSDCGSTLVYHVQSPPHSVYFNSTPFFGPHVLVRRFWACSLDFLL